MRNILLTALLMAPAGARAAEVGRPNVLVILCDDLRHDALSCAGHPWMKTPHIDRLAAEGARFTNVFVTTSLCSPSRASLLSGLYARAHGVQNNFTDFPANLPSYPGRLKEAGYETAYIGKWHMGEQDDQQRAGFDHWVSHKGQGNYFDNEFNVNGQRRTVKGYYTTAVTDFSVDWLKAKHDKPWLLILGQKAPHGGPIQPEPKYEKAFDHIEIKKPATYDDYDKGKPAWLKASVPTWHGIGGPLYGQKEYGKFVRAYFGTIASVDDSVGRIYQTLRDTGQLDNTLIVFTSDNGFVLGEHGRVDKRTMYEESIRIPFIVRYPKLVPQPMLVNDMVLTLDLAPSILDICGAKPLEKCHGKSWQRLLAGERRFRLSWFYEYNYEKEFPYTPNVRGVRAANWKYIHYPHGDGKPDRYQAELYDLDADPGETKNLIDDPQHADLVKEMKLELERLMKEAGPDRMPIDEGIKNVLPKY